MRPKRGQGPRLCEKDSVEEIVTVMTTDHTEAVDSDEDEADEWQSPALNAEQAFQSARVLKEFMFLSYILFR
jgi:hypothetical protein